MVVCELPITDSVIITCLYLQTHSLDEVLRYTPKGVPSVALKPAGFRDVCGLVRLI
jgi:hypothetical protein